MPINLTFYQLFLQMFRSVTSEPIKIIWISWARCNRYFIYFQVSKGQSTQTHHFRAMVPQVPPGPDFFGNFDFEALYLGLFQCQEYFRPYHSIRHSILYKKVWGYFLAISNGFLKNQANMLESPKMRFLPIFDPRGILCPPPLEISKNHFFRVIQPICG